MGPFSSKVHLAGGQLSEPSWEWNYLEIASPENLGSKVSHARSGKPKICQYLLRKNLTCLSPW